MCVLKDDTILPYLIPLVEVIPGAKIEIGPGFDVAEPVKGPLDISRAKRELGYTPKFDLQAGVEDYIRTVKSQLSAR